RWCATGPDRAGPGWDPLPGSVDAVPQVGRARRDENVLLSEHHPITHQGEQRGARTHEDGREVDAEFVDRSHEQCLAGDVGATHDDLLLVSRCFRRPGQGGGDTVGDEGETGPVPGSFRWTVGDDEVGW